MAEHLTVVNHPLVQHKLTIMRDKETSTAGFRRLLKEISLLLAYEVTRELEMTNEEIVDRISDEIDRGASVIVPKPPGWA